MIFKKNMRKSDEIHEQIKYYQKLEKQFRFQKKRLFENNPFQ